MQVSDREIQNSIDLIMSKQWMMEEETSDKDTSDIEVMSDVVKQIEDIPEVRKDKVERIKRAIETSSYEITSGDVAKKMIGRVISDKIR